MHYLAARAYDYGRQVGEEDNEYYGYGDYGITNYGDYGTNNASDFAGESIILI